MALPSSLGLAKGAVAAVITVGIFLGLRGFGAVTSPGRKNCGLEEGVRVSAPTVPVLGCVDSQHLPGGPEPVTGVGEAPLRPRPRMPAWGVEGAQGRVEPQSARAQSGEVDTALRHAGEMAHQAPLAPEQNPPPPFPSCKPRPWSGSSSDTRHDVRPMTCRAS